MMTTEVSIPPGRWFYAKVCRIIHTMKKHFLWKSSLLPGIDQTLTVMMTKEKFAKIVNFMTPEEGVMIGCGHKSQIVTWLRQ